MHCAHRPSAHGSRPRAPSAYTVPYKQPDRQATSDKPTTTRQSFQVTGDSIGCLSCLSVLTLIETRQLLLFCCVRWNRVVDHTDTQWQGRTESPEEFLPLLSYLLCAAHSTVRCSIAVWPISICRHATGTVAHSHRHRCRPCIRNTSIGADTTIYTVIDIN